jgi:hypothetical protein
VRRRGAGRLILETGSLEIESLQNASLKMDHWKIPRPDLRSGFRPAGSGPQEGEPGWH